MSTLQDDDLFMVSRGDVNYKVKAEDVMSPTVQDTDLFMVSRDGINYKLDGKTLKEDLNPELPPVIQDVELTENSDAAARPSETGEITGVSSSTSSGATWDTGVSGYDYSNSDTTLTSKANGQYGFVAVAEGSSVAVEIGVDETKLFAVSATLWSGLIFTTVVNSAAADTTDRGGYRDTKTDGWAAYLFQDIAFYKNSADIIQKIDDFGPSNGAEPYNVTFEIIRDSGANTQTWNVTNIDTGVTVTNVFTDNVNAPIYFAYSSNNTSDIVSIVPAATSTILTLANDKDLNYLRAGDAVKQDDSPLALETSEIIAVESQTYQDIGSANNATNAAKYFTTDNGLFNSSYTFITEVFSGGNTNIEKSVACQSQGEGSYIEWNLTTQGYSPIPVSSSVEVMTYTSGDIVECFDAAGGIIGSSTSGGDFKATVVCNGSLNAIRVRVAPGGTNSAHVAYIKVDDVEITWGSNLAGTVLTFTDNTDLAKFEAGDIVDSGNTVTVTQFVGGDSEVGVANSKTGSKYRVSSADIFTDYPDDSEVVTLGELFNGAFWNMVWYRSTGLTTTDAATAASRGPTESDTVGSWKAYFANDYWSFGYYGSDPTTPSTDKGSIGTDINTPITFTKQVKVVSVDAGNNQLTVDGGDWRAWNQSQVWSASSTFTTAPEAGFDGNTSTYANVQPSQPGSVTFTITNVTSIEVYTKQLTGGTGYVYTAKTDDGDKSISTITSEGWQSLYSGPALTMNGFETTNTGYAGSYSALRVNGKLLVDPTNQSEVWSDQSTLNGTIYPGAGDKTKAFDGSDSTAGPQMGGYIDFVPLTPITINSTLRIKANISNVTEDAIFQLNGIDVSTVAEGFPLQPGIERDASTWTTISSPPSTLTQLRFGWGNTGSWMSVAGIEIDGVELIDKGIGGETTVSMTKTIEGVVGSADPQAKTITLSSTTGGWSANTGNTVLGPDQNFTDDERFTSQSFNVKVDVLKESKEPLTYSPKVVLGAKLERAGQTDVITAFSDEVWSNYLTATGGFSNPATAAFNVPNPPQADDGYAAVGSYMGGSIKFDASTLNLSGVVRVMVAANLNISVKGKSSPTLQTKVSEAGTGMSADWTDFNPPLGGLDYIIVEGNVSNQPNLYAIEVDSTVLVDGGGTLTLDSDRDLAFITAGDTLTQVAARKAQTSTIGSVYVHDFAIAYVPTTAATFTSDVDFQKCFDGDNSTEAENNVKASSVSIGLELGYVTFNPPIPLEPDSIIEAYQRGLTDARTYQLNRLDSTNQNAIQDGYVVWDNTEHGLNQLSSLGMLCNKTTNPPGNSWRLGLLKVDGMPIKGTVTSATAGNASLTPVLTMNDDTNIANFRVGDIVQNNDFTNGTSQDCWDGNLGTSAFFSSWEVPDGTTIPINNKIEVYGDFNENVNPLRTINGNQITTLQDVNGAWTDITSFVGPEKTFRTFTMYTDGSNAFDAIAAFRVDGNILVSSPDVRVVNVDTADSQLRVDGGNWYGADGSGSVGGETSVTAPRKETTGVVTGIDLNGPSVTLSPITGTWLVTESAYQEDLKVNAVAETSGNVMADTKIYGVLDTDGNVTDLSSTDPGYKEVNTGNTIRENFDIKFPAIFPSGEAPDTSLPDGTSISIDLKVENEIGVDVELATDSGATLTPVDSSPNTPASQFKPVIYTGNGGTQSIDVGFPPDLVWIKDRVDTYGHQLFDTVRGPNNGLVSNATAAEFTYPGVTAFGANGFTIGNDVNVNTLNDNYVAWCWKAGDTTVTNNEGSIESQVRAGNGFSIVSWPGTPSGAKQIGHELNSAPDFIIVKNRTQSIFDWPVYHSSLPADESLKLNATASSSDVGAYFNGVTDTVFNVDSSGAVAGFDDDEMIAYCWAETPGVSSFGSYASLGGTSTPEVVCGFKPAFVMIKAISAPVGSWLMYDIARDTNETGEQWLYANSNAKEVLGATYVIQLSDTGFTPVGTSSENNGSGVTYIYAAFAAPVTTFNSRDAADVTAFDSLKSKIDGYETTKNTFRSSLLSRAQSAGFTADEISQFGL